MSSGVKRVAAPPVPTGIIQSKKPDDAMRTNGSGSKPLTYASGEPADDVNMNQVDEKVTLEVVLPTGSTTSVTVDSNIPMIDLLVHLAAKSKVNPSGHTLQVWNEECGKPMEYKANQSIGSLGARTVHIVSKNKKADWSKPLTTDKAAKSFELTQRFTINLPAGQKSVLRISPNMTLEQVFARVCQEKSLDPRRYILQHPSNPLTVLDMKATIGDLKLSQINLINAGAATAWSDSSRSMPDLSQTATTQESKPLYMPVSGEVKKKRSFLSFLSKKEKKPKTSESFSGREPSSNQMHSAHLRKPNTPPTERKNSSNITVRPKTMYIGSVEGQEFRNGPTVPNDIDFDPPKTLKQASSKRLAPIPPSVHDVEKVSGVINGTTKLNIASSCAISKDHALDPSARSDPEFVLGRPHSRNSSDSSGYHELTLSGAESPEATHVVSSFKTSIDTTSIESADNQNGDRHGHESGGVLQNTRLSVAQPGDSQTLPHKIVSSKPPIRAHSVERQDVQDVKPLPSTKKKKAPPPPPLAKSTTAVEDPKSISPAGSTQILTGLSEVSSSNTTVSPLQSLASPSQDLTGNSQDLAGPSQISTNGSTVHASQVKTVDSTVISSQSVIDALSSSAIAATVEPMNSEFCSSDHVSSPVEEMKDNNKTDKWPSVEEKSNPTFDLNEILDKIVFDDVPFRLTRMLSHQDKTEDEKAMINDANSLMMETESVVSEDIQVVDDLRLRPCEFIPPPPPVEPPPPVDEYNPILIDKSTAVGDDNISLAPSSLKNSPVTRTQKAEITGIMSQMIQLTNSENRIDIACNNSLPNNSSEIVPALHKKESFHVSKGFYKQLGSTDRPMELLSEDSSVNHTNHTSNTEDHEHYSSDAQSCSAFAMIEEIHAPLETVPPPLEFQSEIPSEEEDEEEFIVTEEEYIVPIEHNSYDFSAAVKVFKAETGEDSSLNKSEQDRTDHQSVVNTPAFQLEHSIAVENRVQKPQAKEEFVLTSEDLSSVSLLPLRPKRYIEPKSGPGVLNTQLHTEINYASFSGPDFLKSRNTDRKSFDHFQIPYTEVEHITKENIRIASRPMQEEEDIEEEKPVPLQNLPTMRIIRSAELESFSDHAQSSEGNTDTLYKSTIQLATGGESSSEQFAIKGSHQTSTTSRSATSGTNGVGVEAAREELQLQYQQLQRQFSQWQQQLKENQALLSTQNNLVDSDNTTVLQNLHLQMQMQQQMMQQLQLSMQALTLQQQEKIHCSSPSYVYSSPSTPLPTPPAPPVLPKANRVVKAEPARQPVLSHSRFETPLNPREELMTAIRSFGGREGLNPVPLKSTRWVYNSN